MPLTKNNITYYSSEEACQSLRVTRQTLSRYVREGKLTQYKQGITRTIYYKQSEVEALTDIHQVDTEE